MKGDFSSPLEGFQRWAYERTSRTDTAVLMSEAKGSAEIYALVMLPDRLYWLHMWVAKVHVSISNATESNRGNSVGGLCGRWQVKCCLL